MKPSYLFIKNLSSLSVKLNVSLLLNDYEREVLFPLAGERIEIDLDDGVKQNYPLFGKALKKISGLS